MITELTLRNFKSIKEQTYKFERFDLLVGRNNSGKSTILQALAIWQFCLDEFRREKRIGVKKGKQIVLPNFTALPVPAFNLLWNECTDRRNHEKEGKKTQGYILIEIEVTWFTNKREKCTFGVNLRYQSPQAIYAFPASEHVWKNFQDLEEEKLFPQIAYVPPFSGLEPYEEWRDDGIIRKQIGKAQPGSILRNLLLRVYEGHPMASQTENLSKKPSPDWQELQKIVRDWFSVDLKEPKYEHGIDTQIICDYKEQKGRKKEYDIISGGSGFHQALTLLSFLYGYKPAVILLDEPDAHLHVSLQREILTYFEQKSHERNIQFLIATHAEELIRGVNPTQIISLLTHAASPVPKRIESTERVIIALADVINLELTQLLDSPIMLYVEGESDERILREWGRVCGADDLLRKVCFRVMGGGNKLQMKENAKQHFSGVKEIIPEAKQLILFDYDSDNTFHPPPNNPVLYEWQRKNIENYLLVPEVWERAALEEANLPDDLFALPIKQMIRDFFASENLTLPQDQTWQSVSANIFKVVDGKKLLFEKSDSLFQRLRNADLSIELRRERIAATMRSDEIHKDVHFFFAKLRTIVEEVEAERAKVSSPEPLAENAP